MITGFNEETAPLNEDEMAVMPRLVSWLNRACTGTQNKKTSREISTIMTNAFPHMKFGGPRFRKMINHIRRNRLIYPLVSNSNGYWVGSEQEVEVYLHSLGERISAIQAVKDSFHNPELPGKVKQSS